MDKMASGLLLLAFGFGLMAWYAHLDRAKREAIFRNLSEGHI